MPSKKDKRLKVIKIPLDHKPPDIPAKFPSMPILYLELIENKEKIKPQLRNKEYIPKNNEMNHTDKDNDTVDIIFEENDDSSHHSQTQKNNKDENNKDEQLEKGENKKILDFTNYDEEDRVYKNYKKEMEEEDKETRDREKRERDREMSEMNTRDDKYYKRRERRERRHHERSRDESRKYSREEDESRESRNERRRHEERDKRRDREEDESSRESRNERKEDSRDYEEREEREERYNKRYEDQTRNESKEIEKSSEKRLEELLRGNSSSNNDRESESNQSSNSNTNNTNTTTTQPVKQYSEQSQFSSRLPPRLSDIEKGDVNNSTYRIGNSNVPLRDVGKLTPQEEEEANKKRELLFRFDILRRSYKGAVIPEYSEYTDLQTMQKSYDDTVRRLSLDATVDSYKKYLIGGFMIVEFILGNWFKFDMNGFTQQQILSMSSYERLLIELGEKSYLSQQTNWPVEVRLLFLIIINAAVFIVSKMVFKTTGTNFSNMMNLNTSPSSSSSNPLNSNTSGQNDKQKKKMKGPDINLADLKI